MDEFGGGFLKNLMMGFFLALLLGFIFVFTIFIGLYITTLFVFFLP
jgi:hypothetical protein